MRKNRSFLVVVASLLVLFAFAACDAGVYFPAAIVSAEINQTSDMLNALHEYASELRKSTHTPSYVNILLVVYDQNHEKIVSI